MQNKSDLIYSMFEKNPDLKYSQLSPVEKSLISQSYFNMKKSKFKRFDNANIEISKQVNKCATVNSRPLRANLENFIDAIKSFKQMNSYYIAGHSILESDISQIEKELNLKVFNLDNLLENPNVINTVDQIAIVDIDIKKAEKIIDIRRNKRLTLVLEIYDQKANEDNIKNLLLK